MIFFLLLVICIVIIGVGAWFLLMGTNGRFASKESFQEKVSQPQTDGKGATYEGS